NPGGTLTFVGSNQPKRVKQGNTWVPVNTRLMKRPDGSIAPAAATVDLSFSPGGNAPVARLRSGDNELALSWPGSLPPPVLEGNSAVYREVMAGVDLRVEASASGFSEVLVVKTRAAATSGRLAKVRFALSTRGVSAKTAPDGHIDVRDAANRIVFTAPSA